MIDGRCPTELELDRAFSVGVDPELAAHLERCPSCRGVWDATRDLVELARDLPADVAPQHQREQCRTALLAAAGPTTREPAAGGILEPAVSEPPAVRGGRAQPPTRARWAVPVIVVAGAAMAASVIGWFATRHAAGAAAVIADDHPRRGVVHPHDGARFTLASEPPDEIVRLRDGVIDVDVEPLRPGERFRVVIGTDEVEVHGTSFEVVAAGDRLLAVHVVHGRVEVRKAGAAPVFLVERESWPVADVAVAPPLVDAGLEVAPAPVVARRPAVKHPLPALDAVVPAPAVAGSDAPQEVAFVHGWEAMRQEEFAVAAVGFARARSLAPTGPLAEDATFWHAVAVARLHRTGEAVDALRAFLGAYPTSPRAGQASAMLGWLLVETHDVDEAARRFHAAENDANAGARASARQGLEALRRQGT